MLSAETTTSMITTAGFGPSRPYMAEVTANDRLTAASHFQVCTPALTSHVCFLLLTLLQWRFGMADHSSHTLLSASLHAALASCMLLLHVEQSCLHTQVDVHHKASGSSYMNIDRVREHPAVSQPKLCIIRTSVTWSWILERPASYTVRETCWPSYPVSDRTPSQHCCSVSVWSRTRSCRSSGWTQKTQRHVIP